MVCATEVRRLPLAIVCSTEGRRRDALPLSLAQLPLELGCLTVIRTPGLQRGRAGLT
jgi:hypothetical protein